MRSFLLLVFCAMVIACGQDEKTIGNITAEKLHGQWRSVYLKLDMNTWRNTDSSKVFEVDEKTWENKMGLRPVRNYYWADGTYSMLHYNLSDNLVYNEGGRWELKSDTLILRDSLKADAPAYRYKVRISGDVLELRGREDCDGDGKPDDQYYGTLRKYDARKDLEKRK
jgi:hypothetical protein